MFDLDSRIYIVQGLSLSFGPLAHIPCDFVFDVQALVWRLDFIVLGPWECNPSGLLFFLVFFLRCLCYILHWLMLFCFVFLFVFEVGSRGFRFRVQHFFAG